MTLSEDERHRVERACSRAALERYSMCMGDEHNRQTAESQATDQGMQAAWRELRKLGEIPEHYVVEIRSHRMDDTATVFMVNARERDAIERLAGLEDVG